MSDEIAWKSAEGIKDYFLYLNAEETDSLYLNVETTTNDCCTYHPYLDVDMNGIPLEIGAGTYSYFFFK